MNALDLEKVSKTIEGTEVLHSLDWSVAPGQHWVIVGLNGSGKSTLLKIAGLQLHPTRGVVKVLGAQLGKVDIRELRARIGISSAGLTNQLRGSLTAEEVVRCGRFAALEPWWHKYSAADTDRALQLLTEAGLGGQAGQTFATLSSGERQRVLLARTLMASPSVVLLDEPTAGLDLVGREALIKAMDRQATQPDGPASVLVSHHLEDIPGSTTHLLALAQGSVVASGPIDEVLDEELLRKTFGIDIALSRNGRRWAARAATDGERRQR